MPGGTAAVSDRHGPFAVASGRASGFSHDALGAAIAATNIGARVTAAAGPDVALPTIAEQSWGDLQAARRAVGWLIPRGDAAADPNLLPATLWFRVLSGDPTGEQVRVSVLADTPQARLAGGLARVDATLRWSGRDWHLRVPVSQPTVHPTTDAYQLLAPLAATS